MLTESLLLALLSGVAGLLLSLWGVSVFVSMARALVPRLDEVSLDPRVLLFTAGVSLMTGLIFGLAPAWRASSGEMHETLKEGGRTGVGRSQQRLRGLLVVAEVALSLVLLIGAGLLVRSFVRVLTADKGFDAGQVLMADLVLSSVKYAEPQQQALFFQQFLASVKTVPGVEAAAVINNAPLTGGGTNGGIRIEGRTDPSDLLPVAEKSIISPEYFSVMRTPLARGRVFSEQDNISAAPVAIINESLARRYFAGEDPIGRRIDFNWDTKGTQEIVGIVRDIKQYGLDLPTEPTVYVPYSQRPDIGMTVVVRSSLDPASLVGTMRRQLFTLDKEQPLAQVRTMQQVVAESTAQRRLMVVVSALFGALALLLAALGLYGVMAYTVTLRTREIGVRMALGAQRRDVLRLVISNGMTLTLIGIAVGLAGAFALTRLMVSLLFDVTPTDVTTFTAVPALLLVVALLACSIPARRAMKVDPLVALRYE
jgi:putative ABC transport system permease protein